MSVNLSDDPTILKMMETSERLQDKTPRSYLGMSSMGEDCDRKLWNDFRQVSLNWFPAKTLYAFEDGHASEEITAFRLKDISGIELVTHTALGEQIGYVDHGGHFRGHMDGKIKGLEQAPEKWHVWEHKCSSQTTFNKFVKLTQTLPPNEVLKKWNPKYYAQAQLYMHYSGFDRHYLTVALAGSREYKAVRTSLNKREAKNLVERAGDIIASDKPLDKISENADHFNCKWCNYAGMCHGTELPQSNCRTCLHSFPIQEGINGHWYCDRFMQRIEPDKQKQTDCAAHLYIPRLLKNVGELKHVDTDGRAITYTNKLTGKEFVNGPGLDQYESNELMNLDAALIGDTMSDTLKKTFGARAGIKQ